MQRLLLPPAALRTLPCTLGPGRGSRLPLAAVGGGSRQQRLRRQHRGTVQPAATANKEEPDTVISDVSDLLRKYSADLEANRAGLPQAAAKAGTPQQRKPAAVPGAPAVSGGMGNGIFIILLINFALFIGANLMHVPALAQLTLDHWRPQWWQFVTATFMHANWQHLSGNAFSLLVFGRMVEEEEGALGLWLTYLMAGVGGTLASYLTAPHTHTVSLGASGAVFGLFMVGAIVKFKPSLKRLLEFVILGQFVVQQVGGLVVGCSIGR